MLTDNMAIVAYVNEVGKNVELLLIEPRRVYDRCILGVAERFNHTFVVYDRNCVLKQMRGLMVGESVDEDLDDITYKFYQYNVLSAWVGEATPAFLVNPPE